MSTAEYRAREGVDAAIRPTVADQLIGGVPIENLAFFFRQAATMVHAGVGIVQSMTTLAGQARHPKLAQVLREMAHGIEQGNPMSAAMQRHPEIFSAVMLSVVRAGEEGGFLDQALSTVADYIDQEIHLRLVYRRATFWPKLELVSSIVIILAANAVISSINSKAQTLSSPLTTLTTWYVLGPIIVALYFFFRVVINKPDFRPHWDLFITKIPFLGVTLKQISMARFGRSFGALYRSGVPLQKALVLSADACGNEHLRRQMLPAYRGLQEGRGVTETLESTQAFSPIVLDMIRTGETTGSMDQMLGRTSDFYLQEAEVRQHQLAVVVGVVVTLCVCIYIGYIIISFYTGYFSGIGSAVGGGG